MGASAYRTYLDIYLPGCFHKLGNRHSGITALESLPALNAEDTFQIFGLHPIVKKTIVPDLLKSGWQYMKEKPPNELFMSQDNDSSGLTGFSGSGRKRNEGVTDRQNPAV